MSEFTLDTSGGVLLPVPESKTGTRFAVMWSDLDPFTQGCVEAMFASAEGLVTVDRDNGAENWPGFSDLAPETLAAIMKDCEGLLTGGWVNSPGGHTHEAGAQFWRARNQSPPPWWEESFPPLTPYLGDDGRVYLREAG